MQRAYIRHAAHAPTSGMLHMHLHQACCICTYRGHAPTSALSLLCPPSSEHANCESYCLFKSMLSVFLCGYVCRHTRFLYMLLEGSRPPPPQSYSYVGTYAGIRASYTCCWKAVGLLLRSTTPHASTGPSQRIHSVLIAPA